MGLHLIIDGYNLIRRSGYLRSAERQGLEFGRSALIESLAAYKRIKGHRITVVFDGAASHDDFYAKTSEKGIGIRFSRRGQSADTVIRKMAAAEGGKALVVTADRELADAVSAAGAVAVPPETFEEKMTLARLAETKGEIPEDAGDADRPSGTRKKGPAKRPPKSTRRRLHRVKKL